MNKGTFLFLGSGGSLGIPVVGCDCEVCRSHSPHNHRLRPSGLIRVAGKRIMVDCGPDFREQALRYHINTLDGLILTHSHNDHVAGIDELRIYSMRNHQPLPCLLSQETADDIKKRYFYIFEKSSIPNKVTARLDLQQFPSDRGEVNFLGQKIKYVTYEQCGMGVNGFVIGNLAYMSDIKIYPETIFEDIQGVDQLIISALRFTPSDFHFTVDEAIDFSKKVGAKKTWLTHIAHELDHEKTNAYLPANIQLAYDGLEIAW